MMVTMCNPLSGECPCPEQHGIDHGHKSLHQWHTVGASSGPTFDQQISAAKGAHILVIQAWDTAGKLYRLTENVNVQ
jgi:hypothetical protein